MTRVLRLLGLAGLLAVSTGGAAEPPRPYAASARAAYLKDVLSALKAAPPSELKQGLEYARAMEQGACSAGAERLRVDCLVVAVRRYCHDHPGESGQRCPFLMDAVVSRVLAEAELIPTDERYRIVRENEDYRPALAREIHRIQGTLAVQLRLREGLREEDLGALAAGIDHFCLSYADETRLSYQTCAVSLAWFIEGPK
jgi:hypothetical protein